jgi:sporulation protein YlmC with PRC-barrel domain
VTRSLPLLAATAVIVAALSSPGFSQGTPPVAAQATPTLPGAPPTLASMKVDLKLLATGYSTSKVVGSPIVNAANDAVGTLDDLIVTPDARVSFAVLSIGGFLGLDTKYVVVPYSALEVLDKRLVLHDGTKEMLKALPEFKYGT